MTGRPHSWCHELAKGRTNREYEVVIQGHCVDKIIEDDIPEGDVEATVRSGSLMPEKCAKPDKLVFRKRWKTRGLVVVTRFRPTHIKVVTAYVED